MEKRKEIETCLCEFGRADKAWREAILRMTKARVAQLGWRSCVILIDFISEREDEDISAIFGLFRACLEPRIERHHTLVVLDRIFELLQTGERVLRDRDESHPYTMSLKGEAGAEADQTREDEFTLPTVERLCDQIIFMEDMVKLVLSQVVGAKTMGEYIRECEGYLQSIDEEVSSRLDHISSFNDGSDMGAHEDDELLEVMRKKTEELWSTFELYHI